jgi:hypothetical protein
MHMKKLINILAVCVVVLTPATAGATRATTCGGHQCRVGDTLSYKGTAYKVTKVRIARRIGDEYFGATTAGRFVIVNITLTDLKNRPSTILADALRLVTRSHVSYSVTDKAFAVYDNGLVLLENLQPRLPDPVVAVYEVPTTALRGARLEITDLGSGSKAYINLGL